MRSDNDDTAGPGTPGNAPGRNSDLAHGIGETPAAIAFIGRSGSGKTTLTVKVIEELTRRGHRVGSIKHHGHGKFDIDVEGKDSWRHSQAGSVHTVVSSPERIASYRWIDHELECAQIVETMTDVEVVIVEGYKHSGLPSLELWRSGNPRDADAATEPGILEGEWVIGAVTDMPDIRGIAQGKLLPCFDFEDVEEICDFIEMRFLG